ncbi:MAG: hypothetical protein RR315_04945 [Oscillospiraceae bacterium]
MVKAVRRAFLKANEIFKKNLFVDEDAIKHISMQCGGDVRKALNAVEFLSLSCDENVTLKDAREVTQRSSMRYDRDGDEHYDILSAFQKSMRGSDENAALHYLARLLEAGDLLSACRRLLVCAAEDVGLAYPMIIPIVKAAVDSALQLGLPEGRIPLANAVILVCTSPKSNSAISAIDNAINDVKNGRADEIPPHIKDGHYEGAEKLGHATGYKYPHNYGGWVSQQYLPNNLKNVKYYTFGENKCEQAAKNYRKIQREK